MPIGNGRVGANAFVDEDHAALGLLLSSQEAFVETGEMAKVGWLRLRILPPPENATLVEQRLDVETATMTVMLSTGLRFSVYADAHADTFVLEVISPTKINVELEAQLIRPAPQAQVVPSMDCHSYNISADEAIEDDALPSDSIGWFHRNRDSDYLARTTRGELFAPAPEFVDTLADRQTGAVVFPDRARHRPQLIKPPGRPLLLASDGSSHSWRAGVAIVTQEVGTSAAWLARARAAIDAGLPDAQAHVDHWRAFWNRSHVVLTNLHDDAQRNVSEKYTLQRYVTALQARGHRFPIKFNGMLFQAQRAPHEDFRFWGSLNWWQNLRMPYYPLLAWGDGEEMQTLFDGFVQNMPNAIARTKAYWPKMAQPAMFVPEYTHPLFGTSHPASYGCDRDNASSPASDYPSWWSEDRFNQYNHQGALDLALFALDHYEHTANATAFGAMLPHIDAVLHFYAQRWSEPADGQSNTRLRMWPTQGLETWQCPGFPPAEPGDNCPMNDMPTVAGLHKVTGRLLALVPSSMSTPEQRARWARLHARLPPLPIGKPPFVARAEAASGFDNDGVCFASGAAASLLTPNTTVVALRPCEICPNTTQNTENAALYAVHPYRVYGVGRPTNLTLGLNAWAHRHSDWNGGWSQTPMVAAMLGLAEEAARLVSQRAEVGPADGYRFPVFAPPCGDYSPSSDHFAVMTSAVTYMLIQSLDDADGTVMLLPAWPCAWDVEFRVHAPRGTVLEGKLKKGEWVGALVVTPESRRAHVKVMPCQGHDATEDPQKS